MENITLTKLYDVLAKKVGRNEAECLTQYVEIKVKNERAFSFPTKMDGKHLHYCSINDHGPVCYHFIKTLNIPLKNKGYEY
jgi:hypothetical protein